MLALKKHNHTLGDKNAKRECGYTIRVKKVKSI